jgi:hypothetical protein
LIVRELQYDYYICVDTICECVLLENERKIVGIIIIISIYKISFLLVFLFELI